MKLADIFEKKTKKTAWVILHTPDKLILGKRSPTSNNPNQWNFFGGGIDEGESAAEAAARELFEEINFKANISDLKKITEIGDATYFSLRTPSEAGSSTSNEISNIKSFKITDLPDNLHSKTANFFDRIENMLK